MKNQLTKKITALGILAAITIVLVHLVNFPLIPGPATFLKYTPADVIILITTFIFGVREGILITVVVSLIQGIGIDAASGVIGIFMNFLGTTSCLVVAGTIYHSNKTKRNALTGLVLGSISMVITMILSNIVLTPFYMKIPLTQVIKLIPTVFLPFNLVKGLINSLATWILYKRFSALINKFYKK